MSYVSAGVAIVGLGTSIYKGVKSRQNQKKNEAQLNALTPSFYKIQDEYNQNRNIAANNAATGLPESTKNYLTTESQRGLGTGIGALNQMGGNPNDVNRLFDTYENSVDRTAMADAQAKINNIGTFMSINKELAGQKTMQWTLNELKPYERKLKQYNQNIATEKINQNNAVNEGLGYVSAYATQRSNANLMKDLFKDKEEEDIKKGLKKILNSKDNQSRMGDYPNQSNPKPVMGDDPNTYSV